MSLTYLQFLAVFVFVPLLILVAIPVVRSRTGDKRADGGYLPERAPLPVQAGGIALIATLALVYTTPWDNYLVMRGVWWYGDGTVAGRIWAAPVGEYLFIVSQAVLVGLWTFQRDGTVDGSVGHSWPDRIAGVCAGFAVSLVGLALVREGPSALYLGSILLWAGPVFALQWGVGWRYLVAIRRRAAVMVLVPTLYLSVVDRIAIELGIWTLSPEYTTGITVAGLPLEEGLFFLTTSLFVVQALVLLRWVIARWG